MVANAVFIASLPKTYYAALKIPKIGIIVQSISSLMNKRIIVRIDEWKINKQYPFGHYCETIHYTTMQCL